MDAWNLILLLGVTAIWLGFASAIAYLVAVAQARQSGSSYRGGSYQQ